MPRTAAAAEAHPVDARERVRAEIRLRGWSDRAAAVHAGFSNTVLNAYFATNRVGPTLRLGIARAFGWPQDWPEHPPSMPLPKTEKNEVMSALATLTEQIAALRDEVAELQRSVRRGR